MTKVVLNDIASLANTSSAKAALNENFQRLEDALEDTLSRSGATPNQMEADIDLNSNDLLNVKRVDALEYFINGIPLSQSVAYSAKEFETFHGTGVQTNFNLATNPASLGNLDVAVDGVVQRAGIDFNFSGTTLVFAVAPPAGIDNILVRYDVALPVGIDDAANMLYTPPSTGVSQSVKDFLDSLWDGGNDKGADLLRYLASGVGAIERTIQDKLREIEVSPADFGYFDGIADAGPSIQAAIDSLPARGGRVRLPTGLINFNAPIIIGDGDGGTTPSTKNGIKFVGSGAAFAAPFGTLPTFLNYTGPLIASAAIQVRGQVSACELSGFHLALNANSGGISMQSFSGCVVKGIKITNNATSTNALGIHGGTAPTGNYNVWNEFSQISIGLFQPNSTGVFIDGDYASVNDTWLTQFDLVRSEVVLGATNAACMWVKFADNITFTRCHLDNKPEPTANGLILDATGNPGSLNDYPSGLAFYDCSIAKIAVIEPPGQKIGPCYFYGHGANDLEILPDHPRLFGITANGDAFGWAPGFRKRDTVDHNVQNTVVATNIFTYNVGEYFLGGGDSFRRREGGLRVTHTANYINASGVNQNVTLTVSLGGTPMFSIPFVAIPTDANARAVQLEFTLQLNNDVVTSEIGQCYATMGGGNSAVGIAVAPFATLQCNNSNPGIAVDTSSTRALDIVVQHAAANPAIAYTAKSTVMQIF